MWNFNELAKKAQELQEQANLAASTFSAVRHSHVCHSVNMISSLTPCINPFLATHITKDVRIFT